MQMQKHGLVAQRPKDNCLRSFLFCSLCRLVLCHGGSASALAQPSNCFERHPRRRRRSTGRGGGPGRGRWSARQQRDPQRPGWRGREGAEPWRRGRRGCGRCGHRGGCGRRRSACPSPEARAPNGSAAAIRARLALKTEPGSPPCAAPAALGGPMPHPLPQRRRPRWRRCLTAAWRSRWPPRRQARAWRAGRGRWGPLRAPA
jgi:hypothetical protein